MWTGKSRHCIKSATQVAVIVNMAAGQQQAQIEQCFANQYCKIKRMAKVGKNISKEKVKLNKIYLAYRLYLSQGKNCDIQNFITLNCFDC